MSDDIKLVQLVELPDWVRRHGRATQGRKIYPWRALTVGSMMVIPRDQQSTANFTSFRSQVSNAQKRYGIELKAREREDGAFEVVRVK